MEPWRLEEAFASVFSEKTLNGGDAVFRFTDEEVGGLRDEEFDLCGQVLVGQLLLPTEGDFVLEEPIQPVLEFLH